MENTVENKSRFFAQHLGCVVVFNNEVRGILNGISLTGLMNLVVIEDFDNSTPIFKKWCINDTVAEFKPLSEISDEDAIEVAKTITRGVALPNKFNMALHGRLFTCKYDKSYYKDAIIEVNDFLRSRGYLVPFMGLTCEQIIEYKWAKYKQPTT